MESTKGYTLRIPQAIIDSADIAVREGWYKTRTEALVDCVRHGVRYILTVKPSELASMEK